MKNTLSFLLEKEDPKTQARLGKLTLPPVSDKIPDPFILEFSPNAWTKERTLETPCFMPVGTQASVKGVLTRDLWHTNSRMILCNTYHLLSRPGSKLIENQGGLHRFMNWPGGIITDSGGYQVYSLAKTRKIDDKGVSFQHHIDGKTIRLEPESVLEAQKQLGSDIAMVLDECIDLPKSRDEIAKALERTLKWAKRSKDYQQTWRNSKNRPFVFGISQGGTELDLRKEAMTALCEMDFDGYALGGFSVGEPSEKTYSLVGNCSPLMPKKKPRYLMGVGTPNDLVHYVSKGMDLFDCVLPTRNARTGQLFTKKGKIVIGHAQYAQDQAPIEEDCECSTCQHYTRAYLRHLFLAKEILSSVLNTIHNLTFYQNLMRDIREAIQKGEFSKFSKKFFELQKMGGSD